MSDRDKELAEDLVEKYMLWKFQKCNISKVNAIKCAKIDLNNRIELLKRYIEMDFIHLSYYEFVKSELQSLENQLKHLNNL